jgi:hypothetical protein
MNVTLRAPGFQPAVPDISAWRAGNTGVEGVWHFDSGVPGRHVMISALVHGNELCGAWALKGLLEAGVRPRAARSRWPSATWRRSTALTPPATTPRALSTKT